MTRLFHVSDLHFGREDKAAVRWFKERVDAERPDAVICTGDLTMRARSHEFAAAADYFDGFPVPVTVEPGNHDLPYYWDPVRRFLSPYKRYGRVERLIERPLTLDAAAVVPLKTTARAQWRWNWSWGVVDKDSLRAALRTLTTVEPPRLSLVACHHPLVDKEGLKSEGRTKGGRDALHALARAGADVVLSGHVHDPFDMRFQVDGRTIRKVGAGTLSERTRSTPPSFNELGIRDGELEVTVRTMDGDVALSTVEASPDTPIPSERLD